jgi:preprotein translocase subunit SecA
MTKMMDRFGMQEGEAVENVLMNRIIEGAQKRVEQRNYMWRKHVLDYDDVMNQQRMIVYAMRNDALLCEDPREMLYECLQTGTHNKCSLYLNEDDTGAFRYTDLLQWVNSTFPMGWSEKESDLKGKTPEEVAEHIIARVKEMYEKKVAGERPDRIDQMERSIMLQAIDKLWQKHLTDMDALREGVRLRAQGQRDPLVEYKREAYSIFESLMENIDYEILNGMFRSTTNLSAFEDFLASLPTSNADEEDADVTDILGNGDLLSALREQLQLLHERQRAAGLEPAPLTMSDAGEEPAVDAPANAEPDMFGESLSGAMPEAVPYSEKKITLPKKKVSFKLKPSADRESYIVKNTGDMPLADEEEGMTVGSVDSGYVPEFFTGKDKA